MTFLSTSYFLHIGQRGAVHVHIFFGPEGFFSYKINNTTLKENVYGKSDPTLPGHLLDTS